MTGYIRIDAKMAEKLLIEITAIYLANKCF